MPGAMLRGGTKGMGLMNNTMELGRSGLMVPRMGIGAMTWGQPKGLARWTPAQRAYGPSDGPAEEERALLAFLAAGVNLVDTAEFYSLGASEQRVGELIGGRDVLVATKFPPSFFARINAFERALEESLARLGRKTIDLFQHHFPSDRIPIPQLMERMAAAVKAGFVKAVGVSNYSAAQMRFAHAELARHGVTLASNQVQYSLLYRKPEVDGVLDACRELGVTLIAYSPLAMGALTGKYAAGPRPGGLRRFLGPFRGSGLRAVQPVLALLKEIGQRYAKTPSQVALRWLLEIEGVLPLAGVKNGRQAEEDAGALDYSLKAEEITALNEGTLLWRK
jgi:aryl-alcohol dehydrogenase-like predicted oxidoreductase